MWSKRGQPWQLKGYFVFSEKDEAIKGEKCLKNMKSNEYLERLIQEGWMFNGKMYSALSEVG
jgi:hypothetical protein